MRILVQWWYSERAGRVVSPVLFWIFSLLGSFLFLVYGTLKYDAVIMAGQVLSYYIYIRNLQLKEAWYRVPPLARGGLYLAPAVLVLVAVTRPEVWAQLQARNTLTDFFIVLGAIGQLLLNLRFIYQWYHSERAGTSVMPLGFWIISAVASVMVIVYGLYRNDPVLLFAQGLGILAYARNIYLAWRPRTHAR